MYNFKDPEGIMKFKEMTSKYTFLSEVFDDENKSINVTTKQFIKRFRYCLSKCFKKTRVGQHNKKNKLLEDLFNKRRILKSKKDDKSVKDPKEVETALSMSMQPLWILDMEQTSSSWFKFISKLIEKNPAYGRQ